VEIPRAAAPRAGRELSGQLSFGAGSKRAGLFVAHMDKFHFAIQAQSIGHRIQAVAYDAINPFDASLSKPAYQLICYSMWHVCFSFIYYRGSEARLI
jgi:hypothetical protein